MKPVRDRVFESSDGERRTLHQIVYYGWKEGGDIEQVNDDYLVDGRRYTRVDDKEV